MEPELLHPHLLACLYLSLSPTYCFLLEDAGKVVGYILSAPDTQKFAERLVDEYPRGQRETGPWLSKDWITPPESEYGDGKTVEEPGIKWAGRTGTSVIQKKLLDLLHNPVGVVISLNYPSLLTEYPAHLHNFHPAFPCWTGVGRKMQEML